MDDKIQLKIANFYRTYPATKYPKGEILLRPDTELQYVYYLTSGLVSQYDITPSGNEIVVNTFKPGAFFPMSLAINGGVNSYFFETSEPSVIQKAPVASVIEFLNANPDVCYDLLARVYRGTDGLLRRMSLLMGAKAQSRLLFELLNSHYRFGQITSDGQSTLPFSETELARRTGLTRETVSRLMSRLKSDDLVRVESKRIIICQPAELEQLLDADL